MKYRKKKFVGILRMLFRNYVYWLNIVKIPDEEPQLKIYVGNDAKIILLNI